MIGYNLPVLIPLILILGALCTTVAGLRRESLAFPVALAAVVGAGVLAAAGLQHVVVAGTMRYTLGGWPPPIGIEYVLDPLAAFVLVVILSVAAMVFLHARVSVATELPGRSVPFFALALLLLTGFSGIVLTGDLFNLYVFLEISSLSSYALIAVGEKRAPVAAFRYLLIGTIGASFYLLGLGFLYIETGSLNMADTATILPHVIHKPTVIVSLILMIVGVGIKMALFPLHGWLPDAYTYAPSTISALIAPVGTKVGAYVLIRILFFVFDPVTVRVSIPVTEVIFWLSVGGILFGSIMAIAQQELKRMLAYSSVAQIGYIGLGIGLANPLGLIGAVLHVLNHALMKGGLFLVAANLRLRLGHSTITLFDDSLRKTMPWTMAAFTVCSLSMIGIPPTAGFFSKWYLVLAGIDAGNWVGVGVILVSSLLNAVYFFRVLEKIYLRSGTRSAEGAGASREVREVGPSMLVPVLVLAASLLILGVLNAAIVEGVITQMLPGGL